MTTAVVESDIKNQLSANAQKSGDGTVAGVIDDGLFTQEDVLMNQALQLARAKRGIPYESGADFSDAFVQQVRSLNTPSRYVHERLNQDTIKGIQSMMQGQLQRDQQYIGNNQDWTGYYLEPLAKFVVPFDTPVRNMLPRTTSVGIDEENWRAITDVFGGSGPSLSNFILQQQGTVQKAQYNWVNKKNILRQLAFSDIITFEAEIYGRMFDPDLRAKIAAKLAPSLMLGQELAYLNGAQNLWSPAPVNTISTATTGGTVAANTYWFLVTAVNAQGETLAWSYAPATTTVPLANSIVTTGATSTITFNINRVFGATSYRVYCGTGSTQPANSAMWLQSATTQFGGATALNDPGGFASGYFSATMTAPPATSGTAYSTIVTAGNTAISFTSGGGGTPANQILMFDGIQALAYLNVGTLSTVGVGGETAAVRRVVDTGGNLAKSDIDAQLEAMYLNSRANPECMLVSVKDHKAISNIVAQSSYFRVVTSPDGPGLSNLAGGARATKWVNQTTGRLMDVIMVPYLQQGTIIFLSLQLPFQVAEITQPPLRVSVNRDMWAQTYPPDQTHQAQWMYAVYTSETVVNQFLGGTGLLTGIVTA